MTEDSGVGLGTLVRSPGTVTGETVDLPGSGKGVTAEGRELGEGPASDVRLTKPMLEAVARVERYNGLPKIGIEL
jgi:hypothetical protein